MDPPLPPPERACCSGQETISPRALIETEAELQISAGALDGSCQSERKGAAQVTRCHVGNAAYVFSPLIRPRYRAQSCETFG